MEAPGDYAPPSTASQAIRRGSRPSREIKVKTRRSPIVATNLKIKSNKIISI
jgi:hypothetical protein